MSAESILWAQVQQLRDALPEMDLGAATSAYEKLFTQAQKQQMPMIMARCLGDLAVLAAGADAQTARQLLTAAIELDCDPLSLENLARLELAEGRNQDAARWARKAFDAWEEAGELTTMAACLDLLAVCSGDFHAELQRLMKGMAESEMPSSPEGAAVLVVGDPRHDQSVAVATARELEAAGTPAWILQIEGCDDLPQGFETRTLQIPACSSQELPEHVAKGAKEKGLRRVQLVASKARALWWVVGCRVGPVDALPGYLYGLDLPAGVTPPVEGQESTKISLSIVRWQRRAGEGVSPEVQPARSPALTAHDGVEVLEFALHEGPDLRDLRAALQRARGERVVFCESVCTPDALWLQGHGGSEGSVLRSGPVRVPAQASWFQQVLRSTSRVFWPETLANTMDLPELSRVTENLSALRTELLAAVEAAPPGSSCTEVLAGMVSAGASWSHTASLGFEADWGDGLFRFLAEAEEAGRQRAVEAIASTGFDHESRLTELREQVLTDEREVQNALRLLHQLENDLAGESPDAGLLGELQLALQLLFDHESRRSTLARLQGEDCFAQPRSVTAEAMTVVRTMSAGSEIWSGKFWKHVPANAEVLALPSGPKVDTESVRTRGAKLMCSAPADSASTMRRLIAYASSTTWVALVEGDLMPDAAEWRRLQGMLSADPSIAALGWNPAPANAESSWGLVEQLQSKVILTRRSTLREFGSKALPFDRSLREAGLGLIQVCSPPSAVGSEVSLAPRDAEMAIQ